MSYICSRPSYAHTFLRSLYRHTQLYYLWANIEVLNKLRKTKGLNTFAFRPHAGETGDTMHLAATYMLCSSINHGINLDKQVSLQYLYYLDQVGLSVRCVYLVQVLAFIVCPSQRHTNSHYRFKPAQSTFQQLPLSQNQVQSIPKAIQEVCRFKLVLLFCDSIISYHIVLLL